MGLFDLFKKKDEHSTNVPAEDPLIHRYVATLKALRDEAHKTDQYFWRVSSSAIRKYKSYTSILQEPVNFREGFLVYLYQKLIHRTAQVSADEFEFKVIGSLYDDIALTDEKILTSAKFLRKVSEKTAHYYLPLTSFVKLAEKNVRQSGLTDNIRDALRMLPAPPQHWSWSAEERKRANLVEYLLDNSLKIEVNKNDVWGNSVHSFMASLDEESRLKWTDLLLHCKSADGKGQPTQKWLKEAKPKVEVIGSAFIQPMSGWLELVKANIQEIHKTSHDPNHYLRDQNEEIFKALIWCTPFVNDPSLNNSLEDYAMWAYKKLHGIGAISAKTGTAAMYAFSMLPVKEGVSRISKFRAKIKNQTILKSINKVLRTVAEHHEVGMDEMEELSVPSFNITDGEIRLPLDNCTAVYSVKDDELLFENNGKLQKSVPSDIKEKFDKDIKLLKGQIKEIKTLLPVVEFRLEQTYLGNRSWDYKAWRELYLDHPLSSTIASKLIWHFSSGDQKGQAFYDDGKFVDAKGSEVSWMNTDNTEVRLWHPIGFNSETIVAWRDFLRKREIVQPFKQAYREVYLLTEAELRTGIYSNRFAAHIIRQQQFLALCKQRGWKYTIQGTWDSHNVPTLKLTAYDMFAEFIVNADYEGVNDMGIFTHVATDQVRFTRDAHPVPLQDVPALVFTEVMRDVDLFVGVTSIGNDTMWQDSGNEFQNRYWQQYSFKDLSESAVIRSQVLQTVVPQLKIAKLCSFDKKFLIVKGKLRTYKIHMGSGNILMEPDDQYLCIVPAGRSKYDKLYLPFEGDTLLSIIISKAFLLADDDKITDVTITQQINR